MYEIRYTNNGEQMTLERQFRGDARRLLNVLILDYGYTDAKMYTRPSPKSFDRSKHVTRNESRYKMIFREPGKSELPISR